jgi:hypothetical protein
MLEQYKLEDEALLTLPDEEIMAEIESEAESED